MDGFFLPFAAFFFNTISSFLPPPSVLSHRHRSKFFTFSGTTFGLCEQKRDFDCFIHRSRISKRGRKISTHHPKKRALSSLLFSSLLFSPLSKHKEEEESVASQIHTRTHHARHVNHNNDEYDGFVFLFCIDRDKKDDKLYEAKCDDDEKERYRSGTGRNWCCCCGTTQTTSARKSRRNEYEQ